MSKLNGTHAPEGEAVAAIRRVLEAAEQHAAATAKAAKEAQAEANRWRAALASVAREGVPFRRVKNTLTEMMTQAVSEAGRPLKYREIAAQLYPETVNNAAERARVTGLIATEVFRDKKRPEGKRRFAQGRDKAVGLARQVAELGSSPGEPEVLGDTPAQIEAALQAEASYLCRNEP